MKALIFDNQVVDVTNAAPFEVAPTMTWVDCDNTVKIGFAYDGTKFTSNEVTDEQKAAFTKADNDRKEAQKTGNAKLLALGLTQAEATALTSYTPS